MFLLIKEVITPPAVSIPRDKGVTSRSRRSCTASDVLPRSNHVTCITSGGSYYREKMCTRSFLICTARPRTERFLGRKIPRSAQNSSVGGLLLCTDGQIQTRHVQFEVYCYLLGYLFSLMHCKCFAGNYRFCLCSKSSLSLSVFF